MRNIVVKRTEKIVITIDDKPITIDWDYGLFQDLEVIHGIDGETEMITMVINSLEECDLSEEETGFIKKRLINF